MADEDFNDWDPMTEHYNDKTANTYDTGAGARIPLEMQPAYQQRGRKEENLFTLWVSPLDSRYSEDSLRNIFSNYGEVTDVKIVYPKAGSTFGYVTYKSQASATDAIRGFNDNEKFEFKCRYAYGDSKRSRNNQSNNSRFSKDSGPSSRRSDYNRNEETKVSNSFNEPSLEFTQVKRTYGDRYSSDSSRSRDNSQFRSHPPPNVSPADRNSSPAMISNVEQDSCSFEPRDNALSRPRPSSLTSVASTMSSTRNVTEEIMESNNLDVKREPEDKPDKPTKTYLRQSPCCHCKALTFNVCKECGKSFCHAECSLDSWRFHATSDCVIVAEIVKQGSVSIVPSGNNASFTGERDSKNVSVVSEPDLSSSNESDMKNASLTNGGFRKYAGDHNSPATEYRDFSNLARDYVANVTKSSKPASPQYSKSNVDYDSNTSKMDTSYGAQQPEQPQPVPYSPPEASKFQQEGLNSYDRNFGRNNENDRGQGRNFQRGGSNEYGRGGGRRDGASENNRYSGGGRRDGNQRQNDSSDGAGENEQSGGRNYQNNRGGRAGVDRRRNFNEKKQGDEVDNSDFGTTKPPRVSFQMDRNDQSDRRANFDESRGGYQKRTAQSRIGGYSNNADTGRLNGVSNENRDSRRSGRQPEPKYLEMNQTVEVTIVSIEPNSSKCFVRLAENEGIFQDLLKTIKDIPLPPLERRPKLTNTKCIALLNDEWQRGLIKTDFPIKVLFVDAGIVAEVDLQNIREVPKHIADCRPFAYRVELSNASRNEISKWFTENEVISIKATSQKKDDRNFYAAEVISFKEQLIDAREDNNRDVQRPPAPAPTPSIPPAPAAVVEPQSSVACKQSLQLRSKKSVEIYVSYLEPGNDKEFYVGFAESIIDLSKQIAVENVDSLSTMIDIQEGCLALAQYSGEWCRVEIVNIDPLQVKFIDYGNVEPCEAKTLKMIPSSLMNIPPLAIKVKLLAGTVAEHNITQDSSLVITPITKEANNTWLVVKGDKSEAECEALLQQVQASTPQPAKSKPKVALDFSVTFAESKRLIYGVQKPDTAAFQALNDKINSGATFEPVASPLQKDKIYAKLFDGCWCRARLISIQPVEIYFIDFGNTEVCQKEDLFELPDDLQKNPPPMSVRMVLENESKGILEFGEYVSVLWDMEKDTYLLTHDPTDPDSIKASNKSVNVVSMLGDSNYAVILEENRSVYKYIYEEINSNVDQLGKPKKIEINGLCLALYEDENWHRAKIVKKSPLSVYFLDFANEMACNFSQLKRIPLEIAGIPPLAFKVKTEDFIELEEGSEVKITLIEELEYNHWKVATIKEKDRRVGSKCIEIISDPKHISKTTKKGAKAPATNSRTVTASKPEDVIEIDDDDDVVEVKIPEKKEKENRGTAEISKAVPPKGRSLIKPFDETSLVLTRLAHKPKNYPRSAKTITNGVEELSLIEPQRNSTFYDINVPISRHLMDMLDHGDSCVLIIYDSLSDDEYTGMLLSKKFGPLVDVLDRIEESVNNAESISAKRGDLVATFVNGINNWHRGYVVNEPSNVDPYYLLILFDAGRLYRTDLVYRLDEAFRPVPQLAVRINVTHFQPVPDDIARLEVVPMNVNLIEGDTYQFDKSIYRVELTKKSEDGFEAMLMSQFCRESVSHTITVTRWRPTREEIGIKHVPVMTGDLVKIGDICQTNKCHVIPVDDAINEQRMEFLGRVAMHCKRAKSIESELKLNEIVGVPHLSSYYRAQIIERKKDSYMVRILDTGEETKIIKSNIKPLPDALKFADCFAISIQLHNVPCTDFNQLACSLVKYVVLNDCCFTMEINESSRLIELISNDEYEKVDLKKGSSFNYLLSQHLVPLWKIQELDFNARYYLMQMKFEEWVIGSELSLHFAESLDEKSGLMINRYGETYFNIFRVNLHQRLKDYAIETPEQSYVPIKEELCVARFEDNWFRAVCTHADPGKPIELQFIDIGYRRTVPHTDIRRMHSDFLKHPAAAIFCNVVNYQDCRSLPELMGRVLKRCRVLRKIEEGGYDIQVVNLRAFQ